MLDEEPGDEALFSDMSPPSVKASNNSKMAKDQPSSSNSVLVEESGQTPADVSAPTEEIFCDKPVSEMQLLEKMSYKFNIYDQCNFQGKHFLL